MCIFQLRNPRNMKNQDNMTPPRVHNFSIIVSKDMKMVEMPKNSKV
jgi:hypothetical protein